MTIRFPFTRALTLLLCTSAALATLRAQEYKFEIGAAPASAFYMGDANKNAPFTHMNPAAAAIFRYNINFRWAAKANLLWAQLSGTTPAGNVLPNNAQAAFQRNIFEAGGQMEFNFFPYSDRFAYLNARRFAPYVLAGLGATLAPGNTRTLAAVALPLGVGLKYKIAHRLNLAAELSIRKLFRDDLDVTNTDNAILDDPYQTGNNLFKNNDWYALILLSLTWDFGLRCTTCNSSLTLPGF